MKTVQLNWDTLHVLSRKEILSACGINLQVANKSWDNIEGWLQDIIKDSVQNRSKGACSLKK